MSNAKVGTSNGHFYAVFGEYGSLDVIKECGFEYIDYGLCAYQDLTLKSYDNPKDFIFYKSDEEIIKHFTKVKEYLDKIDLKVYHTHAPYYFFAKPYQFVEEEFIDIFKKSILASHILGAKYMVIHPADATDPENEYEETYKYNLEYFRALKDYAIKYNINLAIENMDKWIKQKNQCGPGCFSSAEKMLRLVNDLGDGFSVCLDTGHAYAAGQNPAVMAKFLGDKLTVLHIQDNDGTDDQHMPPLFGKINWDEFLKTIADMNFDGIINLEVNMLRSGKNNVKALGSFLSSLGHDFYNRIERYKKAKKK